MYNGRTQHGNRICTMGIIQNTLWEYNMYNRNITEHVMGIEYVQCRTQHGNRICTIR